MPTSETLLNVRRVIRRRTHIWIAAAIQSAIFLLAGITAFLLRFDFNIPLNFRTDLTVAVCMWVLVKTPVFHYLGLNRGWWCNASIPDLLRLTVGNVLGSVLGGLAILVVAPPGFPRSLYVLDFLLCLMMTAGIRIAARVAFELSGAHRSGTGKRTLIYGAGAAGVALLREIHHNPALAYQVVGFVDDNSTMTGSTMQRTTVYGEGEALPALVKAHRIEMILIALPSATGAQMTSVLKHCLEAGVGYKTIPGMSEIIETGGLAAQIRDVAVEDLLGRRTVHLDESQICAKIEHKIVAVTGAAGSIGSELCRQIARFRPAAIVGCDCSETSLFYIEREMREKFPDVAFHAEICDIRNSRRLGEVFDQHQPSILYHAAAYKHVPMMEAHPFEAVENNVIGTWNVAAAAAEHGIADFVMISSDKAVRPTNIMGVTKRVTELLIKSLQNDTTNYVSVRFGNVLGSNGSVIPLFKQQIAARKPITVTHPEMRRYFMTIPEAAQLVLQASTMGKDGEIFVLDMGAPVRILDLARNLILLSGLRPDEDIKIQISGMRPGEKLYEELAHLEEETRPTRHEKIQIFANISSDNSVLERIGQLGSYCANRDLSGLILQLKDLVPDYNPSSHILRRIISSATPFSETQPNPTPSSPGLNALKTAIGAGYPIFGRTPSLPVHAKNAVHKLIQ